MATTTNKIVGKRISELGEIPSSSFDGNEVTIIEKSGNTGRITLSSIRSFALHTASLDTIYIRKDITDSYDSIGNITGNENMVLEFEGDVQKVPLNQILYRPNQDGAYDASFDINMGGRRIYALQAGTYVDDASNVGQLVDFQFTTTAAKITLYVSGNGNVFITGDQKYILTLPNNTRQIIDDGDEQEIAVTEGILVIDFPITKPSILSIRSGIVSHWLSAYGLENLTQFSLQDTTMMEFIFTKENEGFTRSSRKYGFIDNIDGPIDVSNNENLTHLNLSHLNATSINIDNCYNLQYLGIANNIYGQSELDLSLYTNLLELDAGSANLDSVILPTSLTRANFYGNHITSSNFSYLSNLENFNLHENNVQSLIITGTQLEAIALATNPNISVLDLSNNNLNDIWVGESAFVGGGTMYLNDNDLDADQLNRIFNDLLNGSASIDISNNPGTNGCDETIAESKGYVVIKT